MVTPAHRARPTISVVIPAYNREQTVHTAIRSVLWQTLPPTEVIVVDDGSSDGTAAAVEALAEPTVRLVRQANGGISAARNTGIREAKGDWVAFQDSDDEWLPTKLERQFAAHAADPNTPNAFYCGMVIAGAPDSSAGSPARRQIAYHPDPALTELAGNILPTLLRTNPISTQTLVARRETLHQAGLFDTNLKSLVDWDIAIRLASLGPIGFLDEPLVIQRFTPNSITRDRAKRVHSWIQLLEKHQALFEALPDAHFRHLHRIAGNLQQMGEHRDAAVWFGKARALQPLDPRTLVLSALNGLGVKR
jgi:glycosyltransferase involved in cell wall biosynthesis